MLFCDDVGVHIDVYVAVNRGDGCISIVRMKGIAYVANDGVHDR